MKKANIKYFGFTLVELLAVIVILAFISLITIPVVLNVLEKSRINSNRRSIDLYGKSLASAIDMYKSEQNKTNDLSNIEIKNIEKSIDYTGNTIDCDISEIYSDNTIFLSKCRVDGNLVYAEKGKGYSSQNYYYYTNSRKKINIIKYIESINEYSKINSIDGEYSIEDGKLINGNKVLDISSDLENPVSGTLVILNNEVVSYNLVKFKNQSYQSSNNMQKKIDEDFANINNTPSLICKSLTGEVSIEPGTKYECEVRPNTKYIFYVLSVNNDDTVNLIMNFNICEDGTIIYDSNNDYCNYFWGENKQDGPTIVIEKLYNATKNWDYIPDIKFDYEDEGTNGYNKIKINLNSIEIVRKDNTVSKFINFDDGKRMKARLPKNIELIENGCQKNYYTCDEWLMDNMAMSSYRPSNAKKNYNQNKYNTTFTILSKSGRGYWTLSSSNSYVSYTGAIGTCGTGCWLSKAGIRPVISLSKDYLY